MEDEITQQILNKMDTMQQDIYNKMDIMQQDTYDKMNTMQQDIYNKMDTMQQDIYSKMDIMQQDIRSLQKDVAIIQHEHGSKIQLLLDYAVQNSEEHTKMNALLEKHSSTLNNHEIRLQIVEDKLASSL